MWKDDFFILATLGIVTITLFIQQSVSVFNIGLSFLALSVMVTLRWRVFRSRRHGVRLLQAWEPLLAFAGILAWGLSFGYYFWQILVISGWGFPGWGPSAAFTTVTLFVTVFWKQRTRSQLKSLSKFLSLALIGILLWFPAGLWKGAEFNWGIGEQTGFIISVVILLACVTLFFLRSKLEPRFKKIGNLSQVG